jgi:hypothetical protein
MIIEQLFIATGLAGLGIVVAQVAGANIYDVRAVKQQRQLSLHPYARQYRQRPLVSVVIETHDAETCIEQCLQHLQASTYRKLEIIVIDNASSDATRRLVRQFMTAHPKRPMRLVTRRSADGGRAVVAANVKKYAQGELVLWLGAGSLVKKSAIGKAVQQFNLLPAIEVMTLNQRVISSFSTVGLFQKYQELLQYRARKFASLTKLPYRQDEIDTMYRRPVLVTPAAAAQARLPHTYYASQAIIYRPALPSLPSLLRHQYSRQLRALRRLWRQRRVIFSLVAKDGQRVPTWITLVLTACSGITALFIPFLASYFIYMAVGLHEPAFLLLSWLIVGSLVVLAIWGDEQLKVLQKASYSLLIPITYSLFFIVSFVQIFVVLKTIVRPRKVLVG